MPNFKKTRNVLRIVEWILAVLAAADLANVTCLTCSTCYEQQFLDGVTYGYLIITCIVFLALILDEDLQEKTGYIVAGLGGILYLIAGGVLCSCIFHQDSKDSREFYGDTTYFRFLIGIAFLFADGAVFLAEFILALTKPDTLEQSV